jgi:hypothetical protein
VAGAGVFLYRPPGIVIFPALIYAARDFESPRALRWRRVRGLSGSRGGVLYAGEVLGSGDEAVDDERVEYAGEPGAERSGHPYHRLPRHEYELFQQRVNCTWMTVLPAWSASVLADHLPHLSSAFIFETNQVCTVTNAIRGSSKQGSVLLSKYGLN